MIAWNYLRRQVFGLMTALCIMQLLSVRPPPFKCLWAVPIDLSAPLQEGNDLKESASMAEELINRALAADSKNPLALHLHIHIAEASSPQR